MNEARIIEVARERAEKGIRIARSPYGPSGRLSSRGAVEREHLQTLCLCDALEASRERERSLRAMLGKFHEYMEYCNAYDYLPVQGDDFVDCVAEVASGERQPADAPDPFGSVE